MKNLLRELFVRRNARSSVASQTQRTGIRGFLEILEDRLVLTTTLAPIPDITLPAGQTFQVPLDGFDSEGDSLSFSATSSNPSLSLSVPTGNRSLRVTTSIGATPQAEDIVLQLFDDLAPRTTDAIAQLVNQGFYTNRVFHRIIPDFVAQFGNDQLGNFPNDLPTIDDEFDRRLTFNGFGQLALAKIPADDSATGQVFITDVDLSVGDPSRLPPRHLNFDHTIFGQLTQGITALANIVAVGTPSGTPTSQVVITGMTVFVDSENGVLRVTAPDGFTGSATITVTAEDGQGGMAVRMFTVNVVPDTVNDKTFLGAVTHQTMAEDGTATVTVSGVDLESDQLNFVVRDPNNFNNAASNVTVTITPAGVDAAATRQVTLTPAANFNGVIDLLFAVQDQTARGGLPLTDVSQFDTQRIRLTVTAVNDTPTAEGATELFEPGVDTTIELDGDDGDPELDQPLTFQIVQQPANGTLTLDSTTGTAVYRANDGFRGLDSFTFTVSDGQATSAPATIMLSAEPTSLGISLQEGVLSVVGGVESNSITVAFDHDEMMLMVTKDSDPVESFPLDRVRLIRILGREGDDVVTIDSTIAIPVHFLGGPGNDSIVSGAGSDVLRGGDGNDEIDGGDGEDSIRGNAGDDTLSGEAGNDRLQGNAGFDELNGGEGDDRLRGDADDDTLNGDEGDDVLMGGFGSDELNGGEGNDHLIGDPNPSLMNPDFATFNFGDDTLMGDEGDDLLRGGRGSDQLDGGEGDDRLRAGSDADTLLGSAGLDRLSGGPAIDQFDLTADDESNDRTLDIRHKREARLHDPTDPRLLGERTDLRPGAPPVTNPHVDGDIDYSAFSNPPTYGPHHPPDLNGTDINPGVTPRPPGVYTVEQPDEDLVHNIEHGHVWISYNPALIGDDLDRLERFVRSFERINSVILTPRSANDTAIALATWQHLATLDSLDADTIRRFIFRNLGSGPEGLIPGPSPVGAGGAFPPVRTGQFTDPNLLGIRTDLQPGAPPITAPHVNGDVDYAGLGLSNPPTYGPHHPFDPNGVDGNPGITPRPTGVYRTEQPDEDIVHNLEHGHVWISYDPTRISQTDLAALEQLVRDGGTNTGVILTPRAANTSMIALMSWAHLLTLNNFDAAQIRNFIVTNRGHSPEGFIPSGQV